MKYAIKLNQDGKITAMMRLSDKYIKKFANDPSNPLNQGYELRDSIDGLESVVKPVKTRKELLLETLGITQANLDKLKTLSVSL